MTKPSRGNVQLAMVVVSLSMILIASLATVMLWVLTRRRHPAAAQEDVAVAAIDANPLAEA